MSMYLSGCTVALLARAERARRPEFVFYLQGHFYDVCSVDWRLRLIVLDVLAPIRKSIDDCTPTEWDIAARAARQTC